MNRFDCLKHNFVDFIPEELNDGEIYISMRYKVAIHNCCCGCGSEVVTPLNPPIGWTLTCDDETVSLHPSIGSFSLDCQSHYWIIRNKVVWV